MIHLRDFHYRDGLKWYWCSIRNIWFNAVEGNVFPKLGPMKRTNYYYLNKKNRYRYGILNSRIYSHTYSIEMFTKIAGYSREVWAVDRAMSAVFSIKCLWSTSKVYEPCVSMELSTSTANEIQPKVMKPILRFLKKGSTWNVFRSSVEH